MKPAQIRYSLVTNDEGGILDDVLVYHLRRRPASSTTDGGQRQQPPEDYRLARGRRTRLARPSGRRRPHDETAMIAVQGPRAIELCDR